MANKTLTAAEYRTQSTKIAHSLLADWVGEERAREAAGRIAVAVSASAAAARNPKDFYDCTPQSIATCIAVSALTGIMPSTGAAALAYLIPQPARSGEPPMLQYMLSHRGLNALARRCGQTMIAVPISHSDEIKVDEFGQFQVVSRDIDNPPTTEEELRGVVVIVKQLETGLVTATGWVPKKLIDQRKAVSRSASSKYSPWAGWYVEMAMKTAMHYAVSRGWCVIDDTEAVRALQTDQAGDLIEGSVSDRRNLGTEGLKTKLLGETIEEDVLDIETPAADEVEA